MQDTTRTAGGDKLLLTRWPGSKSYARSWLYRHFPYRSSYRAYVEPCVGSASVILGKERHAEEVIVEKDPNQHNLLRVVSDARTFPEFEARARLLRSDEESFLEGKGRVENGTFHSEIDWAISQYAARRLSRNGEARSYSRNQHRDVQSCLSNAVANLAAIHRRLRGVRLILGDCLSLLPSLVRPDSFAYLDPPYLSSTRSPFNLYGEYEWTDDDHARLLEMIMRLPGKFLISGYRSDLYETLLGSWRFESKEFALRARHSPYDIRKLYREECLWLNY